ncbi:MAG: alpha/beta hydrolase, partial [Candidatus Thorarchaeota archaeon]
MQRIDIRGTMLNLKAVGNGPPLVLVHGLGGDHRSWEFVEPHLSERFRVIMPDLRCHGSSDCPEGMSMPSDYAADIAGLMSHLSIERAPVVGISMGGMVLLQMLLDFPRHVSAAVLVSTTPCVTEQLIDVVYSWREAQLQGGDEAYWWASTRDAFTESFIEDNPDLMDRLKRRFLEDARRFDVSSVLGFSSFDVVDRLGEIS